LIESGKLRPETKRVKATYHDPCHLGRHTEVYEEPRRILKSIRGLELVEMKSSRQLSRCCGGGAGVKTAYPELSKKAALRRVSEAEKTGAKLLVTTCPFCVQTLRGAAEASGSSMEVVELSVLVDRTTNPKR
jgi:Fe-S oxidoreductase